MTADQRLTHFNHRGDAHMIEVGRKPITARVAVAEGWLRMRAATLARLAAGGPEKGDALGVARVAGIMGAKRTAELVPLCHPIPLTRVALDFELDAERGAVHCVAEATARAHTGVEMEALTAVQIALLTLYDMCKSADRGMVIEQVRLTRKSGGRSGDWTRATESPA